MEQTLPKMLDIRSEISDDRMLSPATEYSQVTRALVSSREAEGRGRAAAWAARQLGVSPRRVLAVLHGEVRRIWADELQAAQAAYRRLLAEEEARSLARAALLAVERARLDALDRQDGMGGCA